ncbi:DUF3772 domain-containing protein [Aureimonas sp. SK2]|uniref:DUF3772 domain-containing protein n=1 Tax=Aureimonas sp. SK2 TaxID=3015992 RepID=UPI002444C32B|nr:DUF3772 domain-containing protein [Aureimonas sp. SK2]
MLFAMLFVCTPQIVVAQVHTDATDAVVVLDQGASELEAIRSSLQSAVPNEDYDALRTRAQAVVVAATASADALAPKLEAAQATLATLGEPAEGEAPDVREQRSDLTRDRDTLDSDVKRARLLATTARETVETVNRTVTDIFNRDTLERVASPFTATYWKAVDENLPFDLARLSDFFAAAGARLAGAMSAGGAAVFGATAALALLVVLPLRISLRKAGERYARDRAPHTRARRSGLALWFLVVGALGSAIGLSILVQGLEWADALTPQASSLAWSLALASVFGAVAVSMGEALLLVDRPSWRLMPIDDRTAGRLRPIPVATAIVAVIGTGLIELNRIVGASPPANVTANLFTAILNAALLVYVLVSVQSLRGDRDQDRDQCEATPRQPLATVALLAGWVTVVVSILAIARGNVNLALLIGRETVWAVVVVSGAYLVATAADDLITTALSRDSRVGRSVARAFGLGGDTVEQVGLVLSVILRVAIWLLAASAVLAPVGGGTAPAYTQLAGITSIGIGDVVIRPGAVLRAVAVVLIGLGAVRLIDRWMNGTFLPATNLDAGARNSASTIVRYVGIVVVVFGTVSTLGIGLERFALLASALSVGIGFGLQAITQNFISGLILLAERPVKIGDTIRVGLDEGDVKRINVRSTEIQIGDRSTLIIPNSELITKSVRNMTLANPLGRVQIAFSVPMEEDADEIIAILLGLAPLQTDDQAAMIPFCSFLRR